MRKLLFMFGIMLCLAGCQKSPTLDVVGYGIVEYAAEYDEHFVMINDHVLVVDCIASDTSVEDVICYDKPKVNASVVCYRMSGDDKLYFAYEDTDLNLVRYNYFSVFDKKIANIVVATWVTIVFLVIILLIRNMIS